VTEPELHPQTPDPGTLRRRVLLTGLLALGLYVVALVVLDAFGAPAWYALLVAGLIWFFVVRPLMQPVRDAVRLRRRLAYQAWLEQRDEQGDRG
jgi:hypothetical protein